MEASIQRALQDKIYDKRKQGALELEGLIRHCLATGDDARIANIVGQLCSEYAYSWQTPNSRNGGLIGLAAAAIALGSDNVAPYLKIIVPPVLACFLDQDARVRYYACESMYNIAKVAKGEILVFFNDVFDSLSKLAADSELNVKNGAELLDRLIKDIVSESAATYVSTIPLHHDEGSGQSSSTHPEQEHAFSLPKFIPLLKERIHVVNPLTRSFLVSWVTLLDSVPDLEMVTYLPDFLAGFLKFLNDSNQDVKVMTQQALDRLLDEIKRVEKVKRELEEKRQTRAKMKVKRREAEEANSAVSHEEASAVAVSGRDDEAEYSDDSYDDGEWIPGQDTEINYPRVLEILVDALEPTLDEEIRLTSLRWIQAFFGICPQDILPFVPSLMSQVLPAMASTNDQVRQAASRVNSSLMDYMMLLPDEDSPETHRPAPLSRIATGTLKSNDEKVQNNSAHSLVSTVQSAETNQGKENPKEPVDLAASQVSLAQTKEADLDYATAVGALTLHFLADHEDTRVAALNWLILLHRKAPRKVLATNDGTFPALLKTLSDPDEAVVTKDLQLLAQISRNSDDSYFTSFIENLLQLFGTDRKLLEQRGNLIIRQLCGSLNAERIYRTMADCLEREEDIDFATIMVQCLNNNLITAPQLAELRKRLRNLDNRDGQILFVTLFRSWSYNAVATFSLCLLSQAYEPAYQILLIIGELETTVQMLIEIDKLVQLLESPVFTYLRLQLLEPERYPYVYKCMYGILMLLPQSAAFAALKNRLGSVSAIGYIHTPNRPVGGSSLTSSGLGNSSSTSAGRALSEAPVRGVGSVGVGGPTTAALTTAGAASSLIGSGSGPGGRHKSRDDGSAIVRWPELLDKFRNIQERIRKARKGPLYIPGDDEPNYDGYDDRMGGSMHADSRGQYGNDGIGAAATRAAQTQTQQGVGGVGSGSRDAAGKAAGNALGSQTAASKSRTSLGNVSRLVRGVAQKKKS